MNFWLLLPIMIIISLVLTGGIRKYALAKSIIDIPNSRSSHTVPTPRGGGAAIVLAFLGVLPFFAWLDVIPWTTACGIFGAGALVAIIGFLDDHGHIPARWRLLGHFWAASWGLFWLGGIPTLSAFGYNIDLGFVGDFLAVIYLVWLLNLYNFMDGIDGLASIEAICVCLGGCLIFWISDLGAFLWMPATLAMAVAGFLYWNFPTARIFMGDAGSGFLGLILGLFSLQATGAQSHFIWSWLILLGVFIVDATWTLFRRLLQGDKIYEAHRSHAYQRASRHFGKHLPVSLAVLAINLAWLTPFALLVALKYVDGVLGLIIAYLPLLALAWKYEAGRND
ncbi:MraY family glycosyltransferase [Pseudomonas sp.]|uniref:MraY family glycosyltransferase n=1 Tax=Pseudomonas sp. TaxID=306 RepID=UPI003FD77079